MTFEQAEKELDDATKALAEARKREREASGAVDAWFSLIRHTKQT